MKSTSVSTLFRQCNTPSKTKNGIEGRRHSKVATTSGRRKKKEAAAESKQHLDGEENDNELRLIDKSESTTRSSISLLELDQAMGDMSFKRSRQMKQEELDSMKLKKGNSAMDAKVFPFAANKKEFSFFLQKNAMEIFSSKERDLSARGVAHRTDSYFEHEIMRHSLALQSSKLNRLESFRCYFSRAFAHGRLNHSQKALQDYTSAIKLVPNSGAAYFNRSQIWTKMNKYQEAIRDLTTAIQIDPNNSADYYHNRALLHRKLGNFALSMADSENAETQRQKRQGGASGKNSNTNNSTNNSSNSNNVTSIKSAADFEKSVSILSDEGGLGYLASSLRKPPADRTEEDIDEIQAILRETVAFSSVPEYLLYDMSCFAEPLYVKQGSYVFKEGDPTDAMYLVLTGVVSVCRKPVRNKPSIIDFDYDDWEDCRALDETEEVVARLYQGTSFGELRDQKKPRKRDSVIKRETVVAQSKKWENALVSPKEGDDKSPKQESESKSEEVEKKTKNVDDHQTRRASIKADIDSEFLVFRRNAKTSRVLQEYRDWQISERIKSLKKCSVLSNWSDDAMDKLAKLCMSQQFTPGSVLLKQGEVTNELFFIRCGLCSVMKTIDVNKIDKEKNKLLHPIKSIEYESLKEDALLSTLVSMNGKKASPRKSTILPSPNAPQPAWKEFEVGVLGGGQVTGEFSVLEMNQNVPSPFTVVAQTNVEVLVVNKEELAHLMTNFHGESMAKIRKNLCISSMPATQVSSIYSECHNWGRQKKQIIESTVTMNNRLKRAQEDFLKKTSSHK